MGFAKLHARIHANILKKFGHKFCINAKFRVKKYLFRMNAKFVQNWFRIDTKMMRNFVQNKSFRAKPRNCNCFVETLITGL